MASKMSHPHKLKKHTYKKTGNSVFFCTLPDCHYKIDAPLAVGKRSECNICGNEFIMTEYTVKLVRPHCPDCGKVKVVDAEGKPRYVKKVINHVLTDLATETSGDLRARLNSISTIVEDEL